MTEILCVLCVVAACTIGALINYILCSVNDDDHPHLKF